MRFYCFFKKAILFACLTGASLAHADNQTSTVDTPQFAGENFPFKVHVDLTDFELPQGLHSYALGTYEGKWLFVAGRTNGMHTFSSGDDNFPPQRQNRDLIVVDPILRTTYTRSLDSSHSGLEGWQIDLLSVTSPQFLQIKKTLYITGGYGVDSNTGEFSTKPYLTALDLPGLIQWVEEGESPCNHHRASQYIRHLYGKVFQITGGSMMQIDNNAVMLIIGQNFQGYYVPESNGEYSQQIRRFDIIDNGITLKAHVYVSNPIGQDPNLRRRDLNIVPLIRCSRGKLIQEIDILSGVFTLTGGAWTVPVRVTGEGDFFMRDPSNPHAFKQGMNNYTCPTFGLFSSKTKDMYTVLLGGISYGFFENEQFKTDDALPFINQITAIKIDKRDNYTQFLLPTEYPTILSDRVHPGNSLLFGAGALFIPADGVNTFKNGVLQLDKLDSQAKASGNSRLHVGYIVGGIASTVPNTTNRSDSSASAYIFKVYVEVKHRIKHGCEDCD